MILSKIVIMMVAVLTVVPASTGYRTHESTEDNDHEEEEENTAVDFTKYFGGFGDVTRRTLSEQHSDRTSRLDRPSGLTDFFQEGTFSLYGMNGGTYGAVPTTSNAVPQFQSNSSGFVEGIKIPSFFDASSSASESDTRPHGFPPRIRSTPPRSGGRFFSPSFVMLKREVDRDVGSQRKKGSSIGCKRACDRSKSSEESNSNEMDGFDFSELNFDEASEKDSEEQSSEEQESNDTESGDGSENTSNELTPVTPNNVVNHYQKPTSNRPLSKENSHKNPPTRPHDLYINPQEHRTSLTKIKPVHYETNAPINYYQAKTDPTSAVLRPHSNIYHRPLVYNSLANLNGYTRAYYPLGRSNIQTAPLYKPVPPKSGAIPLIPRTLNLHYVHNPLFKPSPRDVYLSSSQDSPQAKRQIHPISASPRHGVLRLYPQSELVTEVQTNVKPAAVSAYKQKKICKKSHTLKINSRELTRFEPQQMICYTCLDQANNTYEECRYETVPEYRNSETRSIITGFPSPSLVHVRQKRSVGKYTDKTRQQYSKRGWFSNRKKREHVYDDYDDSGEPNQDEDDDDDDDYSLKYYDTSSSSEEEDDWVSGNLPTNDFSFEADGSEEMSDIENEFQLPRTSKDGVDGSCHTVIKKGLTCMVCKNPKTGSSSEQCSSSSDPDDKKYEYSSQSSYGSRRNPSKDRYKRFNSIGKNPNGVLRQHRLPEKQKHLAHLKNKNRRNGDLKTRKLNKLTGVEYDMTPLGLKGAELKFDSSLEGDTPAEVIEHNSSSGGFQAQPDSSTVFNKKDWNIKRSFFKSGKTETPNTDFEFENRNPAHVNKHVKTTKPVTDARIPRTIFDRDDSDKELVQNVNEFVNRNRSACTKLTRGHLTCYRCFGVDGIQHEECLYVSSTNLEDDRYQQQSDEDFIKGR